MSEHCPTINGQKPNEEYDLDNQSHLAALGFELRDEEERADKYVHYPRCDWAIVEWKGSAVPKAIRQIEATVKRLFQYGKKVDFAIVVKKRLNRYERRTYKRREDKALINPQTRNPHTVNVGSSKIPIVLFYHSEATSDNRLDKYLTGESN